jgi:hypothetical protein
MSASDDGHFEIGTMAEDVLPIAIAEAVPIFPPRPDAIVTLLTTDDFLPGAQTLLYSIKVRSTGKVVQYIHIQSWMRKRPAEKACRKYAHDRILRVRFYHLHIGTTHQPVQSFALIKPIHRSKF